MKKGLYTPEVETAITDPNCKRYLFGKNVTTKPQFEALDFEIAFVFTKEMITEFYNLMQTNDEVNGVALSLSAWDDKELTNTDGIDVGRPTLISSLCRIELEPADPTIIKCIELYDMGYDDTTAPHGRPEKINLNTRDNRIVGKEHPIGGKYNGTPEQLFKNALGPGDVSYFLEPSK